MTDHADPGIAMEKEPPIRTYLDGNLSHPDRVLIAGGEACVQSVRSPGKQTANEDAACLIPLSPSSAVLAVADGVGGHRSGEQAALSALEALARSVVAADPPATLIRTAVLNGIEAAHQAVRNLGVGAATTLAVVEIDQHTLRSYHVGDSMILVFGQRGRMKLQTVSHSPVGFAVEAGLLDEREALWHEDRHLVSNLIGMEGMRIEIGPPQKLAPRDTVLLATDGLFDNLHVEEIVQTLRKGRLADGVARLVMEARRRMVEPADDLPGKPDDLTLIAFRPTPPRRNTMARAGNQCGNAKPCTPATQAPAQ